MPAKKKRVTNADLWNRLGALCEKLDLLLNILNIKAGRTHTPGPRSVPVYGMPRPRNTGRLGE